MRKSEKSYAGWYFLLVVILIYAVASLIKPEIAIPTLNFFVSIIKKIILVFILVFILLVAVNYFITPEKIMKYFGKKSGIKGWLFAIIGGIISTGPVYMWYPLLSDMQKRGMKTRLIAAFIYNRAIKPALLPLMILYFGVAYTAVLTVVMILLSIPHGMIVEELIEVKK